MPGDLSMGIDEEQIFFHKKDTILFLGNIGTRNLNSFPEKPLYKVEINPLMKSPRLRRSKTQ